MNNVNKFIAWLMKEDARVVHEWDKWDGTLKHGESINDAQCIRIEAAKARLNCPLGMSQQN